MSTQSKHNDVLESLAQTIDDDADPLHADFTPSVSKLIRKGLPGARAVLHLLDAPRRLTRLRAQRVIEGVVMMRNGWKPGRGYPDETGQEETKALLKANGSYRADASPEERHSAIEKWRQWLDAQSGER
jgi:hypothetical protein